jgi:hypothetical protein
VKALYLAKKSYRRIANEDFGGKVNHAVIQRIVAGIEPKTPRLRANLHLVSRALAETCPKCGQVHTTKRCPNGKKTPNNWRDGEAWWERLMTWFQ